MPNWKKVVVSGSAANLHSLNVSTDVTASNISSSGNIFGNLSENSSTSFKTVVVDTSTGQFYRTGSYGGGGGGSTPTLQEVTTEGNTTNQGLIVTGSTIFKPISSGNGGAIELTNIGYSAIDNPIMTFKDGQGNSNIVIGHHINDGQIQIYDQPDKLRTVLSANFSAFDPGSTTGNGTYFGLTSSMASTSTNGRAYIKMYEASYSGAPAYNFQLNNRNYAAGSGSVGLYGIMSTTGTAAPAIQITSINSEKVVNFGGPSFIHSNGKQNNYLKYGLQIGGGFTGTNANMPLTDGSLIMSGSGGSFSMKSVSSEAEIKTNAGATTLTLGTTSSFTAISASSYISASKFIGDGSQLTNLPSTSTFPFTGDARITGSLNLSGSFDIKGINNNLIIGSGSGESITEGGAGVNNIILGNNAATGLTTGEQNVIIGDQAASTANFDSEGESVVIGYEAGGTYVESNVDQFVAIGAKAGQKFGGYRDVVIGYEAGANNRGSAGLNVAIGYQAGKGNGFNSGNNVWIGASAGVVVNNADNNVGIGSGAGTSITNAQNNVLVGYRSGFSITTSDNNTLLGYQAGYELTNATSSIVIGYDAADGITTMDRQLFIGSGSTALISGSISTGDIIFANTASAPNFSGSFQGDGTNLNLANNTTIPSTDPFPFAGDGIISGSLLISSSNVGGVSTSSLTLQGSGSTIFDIQGSQGQLFSVTDDLIHDVFNVSDISGDTLLKVSGSGLVEIPVGNLSGSATSTASFGHYIGDGSELTGISAGTNLTQSIFVSPTGDNSTAVIGDMSKPFATILGATGSANPGDTIIVYPGTYIENNNLYKDGVNYYFLDGAKVVANSPVEPMWGGGTGQSNGIGASSNFSSSISITGHGEFISTSSNAMASSIFYIRVPSGVIEFKKATKHGLGTGAYRCLSAFGQWSAQDSTGTLTIRGSFENSGSLGSYGSVLSFMEGNINTDIVVRQHNGSAIGVRLWSATGDINGTMDVYSEGYALYTQARTSALSYLKGRFETLTSNQGSNYALYFGPGYRGNFHIDAEIRGAIYINPGDIYEGSVHVRGYQEVSNSPGGGAVCILSGQNQLSQRIYGASSNAIFKIEGGQTTFDGTVRPTGYNSKVFNISGGTFNWKGTCTGNTSHPTTRTDPNIVSGGELVIESQFETFSQGSQVSNEYMFNLSGGTLDIRNKVRNNIVGSNNGIVDMTGGYLRMNGAELVHATKTGSFAYAIDLNNAAHSGSILNNCFTNLTPFGNTGSFTNEIVGGGTLFESHKLY